MPVIEESQSRRVELRANEDFGSAGLVGIEVSAPAGAVEEFIAGIMA